MRSVHLMFRDKTARRVKEDEAAILVEAGKASYISNAMFKAIEAGIPVETIRDRRDDKAIRLQVQASKQRKPLKSEKSEVPSAEDRLSKSDRQAAADALTEEAERLGLGY